MKIKALNGFKDILPEQIVLWRHIEETARDIFGRFQFAEIRLPLLEKTELFARSIGEATDIVEKEMYTFVDKGVTMRPEGTASLLRAYIEHGLYAQRPVQRLYTIGPMFRHERPQQGRLRQFHQLDAEVLGSEHPRVDAELIAMAAMLLEKLGITVRLELNSLGCTACRPEYRTSLLDFLGARQDELCDDCRRRTRTNPMRVLDCKKPGCRQQVEAAPSLLDYLCDPCKHHFTAVQDGLKQLGVQYSLNKFMVRGLDYYCRTAFEFITDELGAQSAVGGGGRYDGLIAQLGGPKNPGIGFGIGMERLVLLLEKKAQGDVFRQQGVDLFLAALGEEAAQKCYPLVHALRQHGLRVAMDHEGKSLKSQMKQADKADAQWVFIVGDDELAAKSGTLRNMSNREQRSVVLSAAALYEAVVHEAFTR